MQLLKGDTPLLKIGSGLAFILGLFHLYTSTFGVLEAFLHRGIHLSGMLVVIFLTQPIVKDRKRYGPVLKILDLVLILLTVTVGLYQTLQSNTLLLRAGNPSTADIYLCILLILLVLEGTRRTIGLALSLVCIVFLLYTYLGPYLPPFIGHAGYSVREIADIQFLGTHGLFGMPLGVMATYIIIFVMFGSTLGESGASEFFNKLSKSLVGHKTGGPAKVAVVASGIMGSVSGSVVANVVTTGSFTIPMMKERGYRPAFAGAVEATASTGGQLMPPIMGAAAFLMAEFLNVPYIKVAFAAALPALLYYISVGITVHLEAVKQGLSNIPKEDCPKASSVIKEGGILLIPLLLLTLLLIRGYTPMRAGLLGIGSLIVIVMGMNIQKNGLRIGFLFGLKSLFFGIQKGVLGAIGVTAATAAAGIIIGCVAQSGLGLRLTSLILSAAGDSLILTLLLMGIACLILGMGMPTAGAYIIVVTLGVPALVKMGIVPMAAHLFVFYMAMMSAVTPPVAVGAYAASSITGASAWQTGLIAFRMAIAGFLIPFVMVYEPALILQGNILSIIQVFISTIAGLFCIAAGFQGFLIRKLGWIKRILLFAGGVVLVIPGLITDLIGVSLLILVVLSQKYLKGGKIRV